FAGISCIPILLLLLALGGGDDSPRRLTVRADRKGKWADALAGKTIDAPEGWHYYPLPLVGFVLYQGDKPKLNPLRQVMSQHELRLLVFVGGNDWSAGASAAVGGFLRRNALRGKFDSVVVELRSATGSGLAISDTQAMDLARTLRKKGLAD